MAEFTQVGGGGGNPSPLKKMKLNKNTLMLLGGGLVIVLLLVTRNRNSGEAYVMKEPTNSADTEAQIQNVQSILSGQLDQSMNTLYAQLQSEKLADLAELQTAIGNTTKTLEEQLANSIANQQNGWSSQLESITSKYEELSGKLEEAQPKKNTSAAWTIGLGTQGKSIYTMEEIKTNRDALKSELERAQSVIEYRQSQGLDTTAQKKYLETLSQY